MRASCYLPKEAPKTSGDVALVAKHPDPDPCHAATLFSQHLSNTACNPARRPVGTHCDKACWIPKILLPSHPLLEPFSLVFRSCHDAIGSNCNAHQAFKQTSGKMQSIRWGPHNGGMTGCEHLSQVVPYALEAMQSIT